MTIDISSPSCLRVLPGQCYSQSTSSHSGRWRFPFSLFGVETTYLPVPFPWSPWPARRHFTLGYPQTGGHLPAAQSQLSLKVQDFFAFSVVVFLYAIFSSLRLFSGGKHDTFLRIWQTCFFEVYFPFLQNSGVCRPLIPGLPQKVDGILRNWWTSGSRFGERFPPD